MSRQHLQSTQEEEEEAEHTLVLPTQWKAGHSGEHNLPQCLHWSYSYERVPQSAVKATYWTQSSTYNNSCPICHIKRPWISKGKHRSTLELHPHCHLFYQFLLESNKLVAYVEKKNISLKALSLFCTSKWEIQILAGRGYSNKAQAKPNSIHPVKVSDLSNAECAVDIKWWLGVDTQTYTDIESCSSAFLLCTAVSLADPHTHNWEFSLLWHSNAGSVWATISNLKRAMTSNHHKLTLCTLHSNSWWFCLRWPNSMICLFPQQETVTVAIVCGLLCSCNVTL